MIKLLKSGKYSLVGLEAGQTMLFLGRQGYHWGHAKGIGDLLTFSKRPHKIVNVIAQGDYNLYKVKDESDFVDLQHLELSINPHKWQGYLLLTSLPTDKKIRSRILPTEESISQ